SKERDSLKELRRYIGKKKKTPNSESFREQAAQRPTSNIEVRGHRSKLFSFFSGRESFCKQGLETWIAAQGIKERTDFDESDEGIAAFAKSALELVDRFFFFAECKV